jgi:spermidine/putrescine transport system substrate-binding protein
MSQHSDEEIRNLLAQGPHRTLTRRGLIRSVGAGAGAAGLSALLAACGVAGQKGAGGTTGDGTGTSGQTSVFDGEPAGTLNFANWPLYIDKARRNGKVIYPSLERFTKKTGIEVNYKEVINANDEFFGTIQPSLQAGQDTGYDIIVITNGLTLSKLMQLDYLVELDHSKLPNFNKYAADKYKHESFDPGNKFTIPWQSGFTGIGYNPELTGREITSFNDLLDPAFKGKVGMFADNQDLPCLALLGIGVKPEDSTPADWRKAADLLMKQRDEGLVRQYYTQNYTKPLQAGDIALTMAWSGDIFQLQQDTPQLKFVVPEEGGILWTDNMCIPAHAQHPVDAITYMDFVYQPRIAELIAAWVWYITPVPAAKKVMQQKLQKPGNGWLKPVASSPLIFPTDETYDNVYAYRTLTPDEEQEWNSIFQPIYQA